jgi:hypothetical protein
MFFVVKDLTVYQMALNGIYLAANRIPKSGESGSEVIPKNGAYS